MSSQMKVTRASIEGPRVSAPIEMQYPITSVLLPGKSHGQRSLETT